MKTPKQLRTALSLALGVLTLAAPALAKTGDNCEVQTEQSFIERTIAATGELQNPVSIHFDTGAYSSSRPYQMNVAFKDSEVAGCQVRLRDYTSPNSEKVRIDPRPIGPTMMIKPGQTLALDITNNLPRLNLPNDKKHVHHFQSHGGDSTPFGYAAPKNIAIPHNRINPATFNITNLHTHGWHVDPTGYSDNIFAEIKPGDPTYPQRVTLPSDHVAGTFWYHAHLHGSTTIQVASGMAGVLQVNDTKHGLESIPAIAQMKDQQLVFQQLAYSEKGRIEDYQHLQNSGYQALNRPIFINGQPFPTISFEQNEVQRWRMVHAGIISKIVPVLIEVDEDLTTAISELYSGKYDDSIQNNAIPMHEIALDGLPTGDLISLTSVNLFPGYRSDVLVQLPQSATKKRYFLVNSNRSNTTNINKKDVPTLGFLLANIEVAAPNTSQIAYATTLPKKQALQAVKAHYAAGQFNPNSPTGNPYENIGPLTDITEDELVGKHEIVHFYATADYYCPPIGGSCTPCTDFAKDSKEGERCAKQKSGKNGVGQLNSQVYMTCDGLDELARWSCMNFNAGASYVRTLGLNTASTWSVSGADNQKGHTFHIHVNPFQVQRKFVYPELALTDPELANTWVWKDTLAAPTSSTFSANFATPLVGSAAKEILIPAKLKSRYTEFSGAFVQHCHVLNHEDQGMMQVVEVEPDASVFRKFLAK